jgi:hypothetical protein
MSQDFQSGGLDEVLATLRPDLVVLYMVECSRTDLVLQES